MFTIWIKDRRDFPREKPDQKIGRYWSPGYGGSDKKNPHPAESSTIGERKNESQSKPTLPRRNLAIAWGAQDRKRGIIESFWPSSWKCQSWRKWDFF